MSRSKSYASNTTTLTRITQAIAAFKTAPSWDAWQRLRRRHSRYVQTHMLYPRGREVEVIRELWSAICKCRSLNHTRSCVGAA